MLFSDVDGIDCFDCIIIYALFNNKSIKGMLCVFFFLVYSIIFKPFFFFLQPQKLTTAVVGFPLHKDWKNEDEIVRFSNYLSTLNPVCHCVFSNFIFPFVISPCFVGFQITWNNHDMEFVGYFVVFCCYHCFCFYSLRLT
jgi:hypothetical protein